MNGDRKVNLHSKYPSISVDWERGLSGVLQSSGSYERVEIDLQHQVSLGLMRDIYWRFGWGEFTNQKELYFVDFANLRRSNLPMGWSDDIGGVFQLLTTAGITLPVNISADTLPMKRLSSCSAI